MSPLARRSPRGFTLLELMMSVTVSIIVLGGVTALLLNLGQNFQSSASKRAANGSARQAIFLVEQALRLAGYGVNPDLAITAYDGFNPASTGAADLDFPDAVVVYARDMYWQRTVTAANTSSITVAPALGNEPLRKGQVLLLLCQGAEQYAYVTVLNSTSATDPAVTVITLDETSLPTETPVSAPSDRFRQEDKLTASCFGSGNARVVKVDRRAFFVAAFDDDADAVTAPVPYLMLHQGLDVNGINGVNADDATPVAPGVEQFQIAYVLNAARTSQPPVVGATAGTGIPFGESWATSTTGPDMEDPYTHPRRYVDHPANIRQVRVTLVSRGTSREANILGDNLLLGEGGPTSESSDGNILWSQMENLGAPDAEFNPSGRGYSRSILRIAVAPKNLMMRSQFLPPNGDHGG